MTETAIVKYEFRPASPVGETGNVKLMLHSDRMRGALTEILPHFSDEAEPGKHIERLTAQAALAFMQNAKLKECTQISFFDSMMHVAETGLSLSRQSGEAYLVPFRDKRAGVTNCTFMPGYRGIIKLAHQTGTIQAVDAFAVYAAEVEKFRFWEDETGTHVHSEPDLDDLRLDKDIRYVVARVQLVTGGRIVKVMNREQVERIRAGSKSKDGDAWRFHWGEMALKTVIKRALKTIPQSTSDKASRILERAIELDNESGGFIDTEAIDADLEQRRRAKKEAWDAAAAAPAGSVEPQAPQEAQAAPGEAIPAQADPKPDPADQSTWPRDPETDNPIPPAFWGKEAPPNA